MARSHSIPVKHINPLNITSPIVSADCVKILCDMSFGTTAKTKYTSAPESMNTGKPRVQFGETGIAEDCAKEHGHSQIVEFLYTEGMKWISPDDEFALKTDFRSSPAAR